MPRAVVNINPAWPQQTRTTDICAIQKKNTLTPISCFSCFQLSCESVVKFWNVARSKIRFRCAFQRDEAFNRSEPERESSGNTSLRSQTEYFKKSLILTVRSVSERSWQTHIAIIKAAHYRTSHCCCYSNHRLCVRDGTNHPKHP